MNNQSLFNIPSKDEVRRSFDEEQRFNAINKREYISQAIEVFNRLKNQRRQPDVYEIKTRLTTLFLDISDALQDNLTPEEYLNLLNNLESDKYELLLDGFRTITSFLYKKGLMKIFKNEVLL